MKSAVKKTIVALESGIPVREAIADLAKEAGVPQAAALVLLWGEHPEAFAGEGENAQCLRTMREQVFRALYLIQDADMLVDSLDEDLHAICQKVAALSALCLPDDGKRRK